MSTVFKEEIFEQQSAAVVPLRREPAGPEPLLFNRELSLLEFHGRVLEEALDESNRLLERLKFIGIFAANLDEFFMIRVSGLKEEVQESVMELSPDGLTPASQLTRIRERLLTILDAQADCLRYEIMPQLKDAGIEIAAYDSLSVIERHLLNSYFTDHVFPVLTPLAVDPSHPFPYISPGSVNLGLMVQPPAIDDSPNSEARFVRVKVPSVVPAGAGGWLTVPVCRA